MRSKIKETDKKICSYEYEVGMLYIQKSTNTVVLSDRNSNYHLRGVCIVQGTGIDHNGNPHYIGEYRADWAHTFQKFEGEIILEQ
jgi:hypothetical protein